MTSLLSSKSYGHSWEIMVRTVEFDSRLLTLRVTRWAWYHWRTYLQHHLVIAKASKLLENVKELSFFFAYFRVEQVLLFLVMSTNKLIKQSWLIICYATQARYARHHMYYIFLLNSWTNLTTNWSLTYIYKARQIVLMLKRRSLQKCV